MNGSVDGVVGGKREDRESPGCEVDSFGVSLVRSTKATRSSCQHSPSDSDRVLLPAETWCWRLGVGSGFLVADPLEVTTVGAVTGLTARTNRLL
jgi:hypothetical protein